MCLDGNFEYILLSKLYKYQLGSKGSQDDLTLYPITEEHNQESDECNQLRLSDIDLEI